MGANRAHADDVDFEQFAVEMMGRLNRLAYVLTGSAAEADDVVQETLIRLHRHWNRVARAQAPEAYATRILTNAFLSTRRRAWFSRVTLVEETPETPAPGGADTAEPSALWPHVTALPPRQRAVVVLRYYEGLSEAEIADVLGCARGTVKSNASKALASLRATVDRADVML